MTASHDLAQRATAFVAEAERMTNERDVDAIRDVFAPHKASQIGERTGTASRASLIRARRSRRLPTPSAGLA